MKFYLRINSELLIITVVFLFRLAKCKFFYAYEYENANISWHFHIYQQRKEKFILCRSEHEKSFITSGPVFQSIVSLTTSLVKDLLSLIVLTKSIAVYIFAFSFRTCGPTHLLVFSGNKIRLN